MFSFFIFLSLYSVESWILSFQGLLIFPKGLFSVVQEAAFPPFIAGMLIHSLGRCVLYSLKDVLFFIPSDPSLMSLIFGKLIFQFLQHWVPMASSRVVLPPFCPLCFIMLRPRGLPPSFCTSILVVFFFIKGFIGACMLRMCRLTCSCMSTMVIIISKVFVIIDVMEHTSCPKFTPCLSSIQHCLED